MENENGTVEQNNATVEQDIETSEQHTVNIEQDNEKIVVDSKYSKLILGLQLAGMLAVVLLLVFSVLHILGMLKEGNKNICFSHMYLVYLTSKLSLFYFIRFTKV